ncbi:MAG: DUF3530 family protein [Glaciecola sp.]
MRVIGTGFFFIVVVTAILGILLSSDSHANDDLAYHLPEHKYELIDITFNDSTIAIPVIKHASELALSKGIVLLVADVDAKGMQQQALLTMASDLTQWGWNTLFVVPKEAYFVPPPVIKNEANEDNTNNETESASSDVNDNNTETLTEPEPQSGEDSAEDTAPENVNESPPEPIIAQQTELKPFELQSPQLNYTYEEYTTFTQVLLQRLTQQYMSKPGYKILVSQGKTSSVALNILQSTDANNTPPMFNALVLNNVHWPSSMHNSRVSKHLSKVSIPILDFTASNDNAWARLTQKARIVDSRVALKSLYRQRDVSGTHYSMSQSQYLSTEMRGFTSYLGW